MSQTLLVSSRWQRPVLFGKRSILSTSNCLLLGRHKTLIFKDAPIYQEPNMRDLVEWNDDLSVGIQEIDEQHKILVNLLNRLYHAVVTRNDSKEVIESILNELAQYTYVHFAVEESLMRIFNFTEYDTHKQHHAELAAQVFDLNRKVRSGEAVVSMELLNFLRSWLMNHIIKEDKRYTPHFLKHGLKAEWEQRSWMGKIWDAVHHHK
jgi:hemerythrin